MSTTTKPATPPSPLCTVVSSALLKLCATDQNKERPTGSTLMFYAETVPKIEIRDYCTRLEKYMKCSPECFIIAVGFLKRFMERRDRREVPAQTPVSMHTIHRLYAVSLVIAAKMRDDIYYGMPYYAQVIGVPVKKLLDLELVFFSRILVFDASCPTAEYLSTVDWVTSCCPDFCPNEHMDKLNIHCRKDAKLCSDPTLAQQEQKLSSSAIRL
jgi:hypothetical protein